MLTFLLIGGIAVALVEVARAQDEITALKKSHKELADQVAQLTARSAGTDLGNQIKESNEQWEKRIQDVKNEYLGDE